MKVAGDTFIHCSNLRKSPAPASWWQLCDLEGVLGWKLPLEVRLTFSFLWYPRVACLHQRSVTWHSPCINPTNPLGREKYFANNFIVCFFAEHHKRMAGNVNSIYYWLLCYEGGHCLGTLFFQPFLWNAFSLILFSV